MNTRIMTVALVAASTCVVAILIAGIVSAGDPPHGKRVHERRRPADKKCDSTAGAADSQPCVGDARTDQARRAAIQDGRGFVLQRF